MEGRSYGERERGIDKNKSRSRSVVKQGQGEKGLTRDRVIRAFVSRIVVKLSLLDFLLCSLEFQSALHLHKTNIN